MIHPFIEKSYRDSFRPVPREPIYEWARTRVKMDATAPIPGYYRIEWTPQMKEPLDTYQDESIRHQITIGPNQGGRTKAMEVASIWVNIHRPGPGQYNVDTNPKAGDFAEERWWPTGESVAEFRNLLPSNHDKKRKAKVIFSNGLPFVIQGANESNFEQKSVMNQFNDEVFQWGQGLLAAAHRRCDVSYAWTCKIWDGSVAGDEGHDLEVTWKESSMGEWSFACRKCQHVQEFDFDQLKWDTNETTKPNGEYRFSELRKTVRYQCANQLCCHEYDDTQFSRRVMNNSASYVHADPTNPLRGHRYNILCVNWPGLTWGKWVEEFLKAKTQYKMFGDPLALKGFWTRRMAKFWEEARYCGRKDVRKRSDYKLGEPNFYITNTWGDDENIRFMGVDRQEFGYPYVIRACKAGGASRLIATGADKSPDEVEHLQKQFGIHACNVLIDCGYERLDTFKECVNRGWTAMRGSGKEQFLHRIKDPRTLKTIEVWRPYSQLDMGDPGMGKREQIKSSRMGLRTRRLKLAPYYEFSNLSIKNILDAFKSGRAEIYWGVPEDVGKQYIDEINSETRYRITNTKGVATYFWSNAGRDGKSKKKANHAWDCEVMIMTAMIMQKIIDLELYVKANQDHEIEDLQAA